MAITNKTISRHEVIEERLIELEKASSQHVRKLTSISRKQRSLSQSLDQITSTQSDLVLQMQAIVGELVRIKGANKKELDSMSDLSYRLRQFPEILASVLENVNQLSIRVEDIENGVIDEVARETIRDSQSKSDDTAWKL